MTLEALVDVKNVGGYEVGHYFGKDHSGPEPDEQFIIVSHEDNALGFKLQKGPIKEHGVNGCQVDQLIQVAKLILEGLNNEVPCDENLNAIGFLGLARDQLLLRKAKREAAGVEGTSVGISRTNQA